MLRVEIDYYPEDAMAQTLTAEMTEERFAYVKAMTEDPARTKAVVQITSKIRQDAPEFGWTFEVGRIVLRQIGEVR